MKKNIYKFSDFLVESITDELPEWQWKEITPTNFYQPEFRISEKFTKEELNHFNEFTLNVDGIEQSPTWNNGSTIQFEKKDDFKITILKYYDEWFLVGVDFSRRFLYTPNKYYVVSQFGLDSYGLKNLLNHIVTQVI